MYIYIDLLLLLLLLLFFCETWRKSAHVGNLESEQGVYIVPNNLVGGIPTPLKNMSSSVGMMKFPIYGKIKNVPNHQPVYIYNDIFF